MPNFQQIYSFDSSLSVEAEVVRPDRYRDLFRELGGGIFIPRGAGVSYVLASARRGSRTILSEKFNRFLAFDQQTGLLTVEAGVSVGEVARFAGLHGLWMPVLPGHPSITIGGCVAFNVHGKSQSQKGCFIDHVEKLSLFHPAHGHLLCSRTENRSVFELTVGGLGLTGFLTSITLRLVPLLARGIVRSSVKVSSLIEAVGYMQSNIDTCDLIYSWNDLNARGGKFGRGFVYSECFADVAFDKEKRFRKLHHPPHIGVAQRILAPLVTRYISAAYAASEALKPSEQRYELLAGAFPISGKEIYHRLFGPRGLMESQFIVPFESWAEVVKDLKNAIQRNDSRVALGSLKLFAGEQRNLDFNGDGVCFSIDTMRSASSLKLFTALDEIVINYNGLPSLYKDSRLPREIVEATYHYYAQFREKICEFDSSRAVRSELSDRLGI